MVAISASAAVVGLQRLSYRFDLCDRPTRLAYGSITNYEI